MNTKSFLLLLLLFMSTISHAENTYDVIITTDKEQIRCSVKEISDVSVSFVRADKPANVTYSLPKEKIFIIQFADGSTETFLSEKPSNNHYEEQIVQQEITNLNAQETSITTDIPKDYAIVQTIGSIYVFNDCSPIDSYKVIGEVSFSGSSGGSTYMSVPNGLGGSTLIVSSEEKPQYSSIRNGLVANAVMANREVEGIIISIPKEGEGRATMIKFTEKSERNKIAKVNNHRGLLVFSDCSPMNSYTSIKRVKGQLVYWSTAYDYIRDKLLEKAAKTKNCNAVIINLVEGGRDYVETITL